MRLHFNYHAVPGNVASLEAFREQVSRHWLHALRRRGQKSRVTWERFRRLLAVFIPRPKILHPHPNVRFDARHPR